MRRLAYAAWAALAFHLLAGLAMLLILGRGLETNPDLADRLSFLAERPALWAIGWLSWTLAGASIFAYYLAFLSAHQETPGARHAVLALTLAAIACDWSAQYIEVFVLPELTGSPAEFLAAHRRAVLLTGAAANGLYMAAAALLLWRTRQAYRAWILFAGTGVVLFGAALSLASVLGSTAGLFWTNAGLIPCLLAWLAGVGATAWRRAR